MDMKKDILHDGGDPMGAAIYDFHKNGRAGVLKVYSSEFDDDEIPVRDLFRSFDQMPELEKLALEMAEGEILDVGAGSGCHSLALMAMGKKVRAMDISPLSVNVMKERGVDAAQVNFGNKGGLDLALGDLLKFLLHDFYPGTGDFTESLLCEVEQSILRSIRQCVGTAVNGSHS